MWLSVSCANTNHVIIDSPEPEAILEHLEASCVISNDGTITCPIPLVEQAMVSMINYWEAWKFSDAELQKEKEKNSIDKQQLRGELNNANLTKWILLGIGAAGGVAATCLVVLAK
jgi:tRNA A58 N-methylase Trm61